VRVKITGTDLLTLDVHANVIARLDDTAPAEAEADADDLADNAGPLQLAIDVAGDGTEGDTSPSAETASAA
jgi:exoribonuclease-2